MAQATAVSLTSGRRLLFRPLLGGNYALLFAPPTTVSEHWSQESFTIEAKLRTQLSPDIAARWDQYSSLVESLLVAVSGQQDFSTGLQSTKYYRVDPDNPQSRVPRTLRGGLVGYEKTLSALDHFGYHRGKAVPKVARQRPAIQRMDLSLERAWSTPAEKALIAGNDLTQEYARVAAQVLKLEGEVASDVQASHVRGYSTTTRDLLHELFPVGMTKQLRHSRIAASRSAPVTENRSTENPRWHGSKGFSKVRRSRTRSARALIGPDAINAHGRTDERFRPSPAGRHGAYRASYTDGASAA